MRRRRARERVRPITITRHYLKGIPGSVLIEMGGTKVICCATIEDRIPSFLRGKGEGWIKGEYSMLPCSSPIRISREAAIGRVSGRTHEIQRLIGRSLRAVLDLKTLGERTVILDCDVIQADGGTRCASITGGFVAVVDLIDHLIATEVIVAKDLIKDSVAAVSVGVVDGKLLLDLDYAEDVSAEVDFNVVMTGNGRFIEIQGTGEKATFTKEDLKGLLALAKKGIEQLTKAQKKALKERFKW